MSQVYRHRYSMEVILESPLAGQGLNPAALGVDTSLARDHAGRLVIPGALLRGVLKNVLEEMAEAMEGKNCEFQFDKQTLEDWFGRESGDVFISGPDRSFGPDRSRLRVFDLVCQTKEEIGTLTRVQIDHHRGSVKSGNLQVVEQPFPHGALVRFLGEIAFYGTEVEAEKLAKAVGLALRFIPALGGVKTAGFGNVAEKIVLKPAGKEAFGSQAGVPPEPVSERMAFDLIFEEPFLVDADLLGGNVFAGRSIIPGGVIKGCLARLLDLSGELNERSEALSKVLISHAFPTLGSQDGQRPRQIPASVIKVKNQVQGKTENRFFDYFNVDLNKANGIEPSITFGIDWKDRDSGPIKDLFGWPKEPESHIRTRTKIDPSTGGSEAEKLFSYRAVVPGDLKWRFVVDRGRASKTDYAKIISALMAGLDFIGKTGAAAECVVAGDPCTEVIAQPQDGLWRVTLQTPAWLLQTEAFTGEAVSLRQQYQAYWKRILSLRWPEKTIALDLEFLASQYWAGGYLGRRYPVTGDSSDYKPYLLTREGSVFQLLIEGPTLKEQEEFFAEVARRGLPVVAAQKLDQPDLWEKYPYVPENGYGEIKVDWADAELLKGGWSGA